MAETVKRILERQKKTRGCCCEGDKCKTSCVRKGLGPIDTSGPNTIPFILYCGCDPYKVEGVTTCFDPQCGKEKFLCFTTFIFRVKKIKDDCAVLELLKFKNHKCGSSKEHGHVCTPCCQLHCENVEDLMPTGVCINTDLSCFCTIQCLPAIRI